MRRVTTRRGDYIGFERHAPPTDWIFGNPVFGSTPARRHPSPDCCVIGPDTTWNEYCSAREWQSAFGGAPWQARGSLRLVGSRARSVVSSPPPRRCPAVWSEGASVIAGEVAQPGLFSPAPDRRDGKRAGDGARRVDRDRTPGAQVRPLASPVAARPLVRPSSGEDTSTFLAGVWTRLRFERLLGLNQEASGSGFGLTQGETVP